MVSFFTCTSDNVAHDVTDSNDNKDTNNGFGKHNNDNNNDREATDDITHHSKDNHSFGHRNNDNNNRC